MEEIEGGDDEKVIRNPFDRAGVQLCKLVHTVPEGENWLYELKYDGYRIMAFVEGNSVRLITRNNNDYTDRFGAVASTLLDMAAGRAMVLVVR
ncbi:MAG: ATP-dependent DNA ligase [Pelotomaculum sp. PtaB.Bin104]|nr:MAG: ATP-dependent DNA ligase [Pelotomaculum sp. PtaB.Bin104]